MRVEDVRRGSPADATGVAVGDELVAIGDTDVADSLDVAYALGWAAGTPYVTFVFDRDGLEFSVVLAPDRPEDLGLTLEEDRYRSCTNGCVFCFVDQLPPGLRESLSFKDEDFRLSFTLGNYVTLTNLAESDYARIRDQRLSPLYVSVHATEDEVRRRMLGNAQAPPVLEALMRLGEMGIRLHTQVVVVPGMNDGRVLERTLDDLSALEAVSSVAVVPVGLTAHRQGLTRIEPVTTELAGDIIDAVESRQAKLLADRGSRVVFAADELYLRAGRALPPLESYEDLPQIENGVGLLRSFELGFNERLERLRLAIDEAGGRRRERPALTVLTGSSAAPFLDDLTVAALAGAGLAKVTVVAVANSLLGDSVTVAGLLTGADMARAAADSAGSDLTLVPVEAFNADGLTIDDMSVADIARAAGVRNLAPSCDIIDALEDWYRRDDSPGASPEKADS